MNKLLLVDCDGTIRKPLSKAKFISHPTDQRVISPSDKAIAGYACGGFIVMGITNQGGVEKGYKTLESTIEEQAYTLRLFPQIRCIFFCPDYAGMQLFQVWLESDGYNFAKFNRQDFLNVNNPRELLYDSFRKPGSGMIRFAIDSLDDFPQQVLYVGDSREDEAAANAAGVGFVWASDWRDSTLY